MNTSETSALIGRPLLARLKYMGEGLKVKEVSPGRLMVRPVTPETDLDRLERARILTFPSHLKAQYTPPASTGIVVQVGADIKHWQPGDMVMFGALTGSRYHVDKVEIIILDESEVMCSLEPTSESSVEVVSEEPEPLSDEEIADVARLMGKKKPGR